jgi:hypothetical protein
MTSRFVSSKFRQAWLGPGRLAIGSLAAVITAGDQAGAADGRNERALAFEFAHHRRACWADDGHCFAA